MSKNRKQFFDLAEVQVQYNEMTGLKEEVDAGFFYDLFRHGEHHVSEFEWSDLIKRATIEDIGHFIINSIRILICSPAATDHEINLYIIPLYRNAKNWVESGGKDGSKKLIESMEKTLELYRKNGYARSTALEGLHWHMLAHLGLTMRNGTDWYEIETRYSIAHEEICNRIGK